MIRLCDLLEWVAANEQGRSGGWTVREKMDTEPVLLIAHGNEDDMRIIATAPKALALLARMLKGSKIADQHHVWEAAKLLDEAGILWR